MTDTNEKLRSLFLTALMVFSVFAGTVAFSGGAAAAANVGIDGSTEYSANNGDNTIEVQLNTTLADPVDPADDDTDEVRVFVERKEVADGNINVQAGGDGQNGRIELDITGPLANPSPNQNVTVVLQGVSANNVDSTTLRDKNVQVTSRTIAADGTNVAGGSIDSGLNYIDVYRGERLAIEDTTSGPTAQTGYTVRENGGSIIASGTFPDNSDVVRVNTKNLDVGEDYNVTLDAGDDGSIDAAKGFTVNQVGLAIEAVDNDISDEDDLEANVTITRGGSGAEVLLRDGSGDIVDRQNTTSLVSTDNNTFNFGSQDADDGPYTVRVIDNQTTVSATTNDINVTEAASDDVAFSQSVYEEDRGDVVNVTLELTGTDEAKMQLGNVANDNYNLTIEATDDNDDGEINLEINTYVLGSSAADSTLVTSPNDEIDLINEDTDGLHNENIGENTLDASSYEMNATTDVTGKISDEDDVATISLTERSTDDLTVWRAPASDFSNVNDGEDGDVESIYSLVQDGNLTQGDVVSYNDTLVVQVDASGLEGALKYTEDSNNNVDNATEAYDALEGAGAINMSIIRSDPGPNVASGYERFQTYDNEYRSVIYDEANDTHFVAIDTDAFFDTGNLQSIDDGEELEANFTLYSEDSNAGTGTDLTVREDENEFVNGTFTGESRDGELNNGDDITVRAASGQMISGTTNLPPASEVTVRIRSSDTSSPFLTQPEAVVSENGTFTVTSDFSDQSPGTNFTAQARIGGNNLGDEIDGEIAGAATASVSISDQESDGSTVVVDSAQLSDGGFIAIHEGSATGDVIGASDYLEAGSHSDIEVTLDTPQDGDFTAVAMPHMDTDGDETYDFPDNDGPYTDNGTAVTDSASVTIATEDTPTETEAPDTETEAPDTDTEAPDTDTEMPDTETTTGDSGPGFTAAIALIALVAAALLAVRRNN